jgi:polar amino acid transport system substrate-binding protein
MSKIIKHLSFIFILSYSFSSFAAFKECESSLKLSSTSEWYPYIYQDEAGKSTGVDVELLSLILRRMGCQLEVVHFPERRALFELKQGRFDIALGASKNASRLKAFFYSTSYRDEVNKFAYRMYEQDIEQANSFQDILKLKKTIAINYAGWYGDEIAKAKKEHKFFSYSPTVTKRLKMLNLGRVDIVVDDEIALCSEIQRNEYRAIKIHHTVLFKTPIHFIFNKESVSQLFLNEFNRILESKKDDMSLPNYIEKQLPANCKTEINYPAV